MKDKAAHPDLEFFVCERLRKLGYRSASTIRLYGEELHLISDPAPHENGFVVEAIAVNSMTVKRIQLPLPVVRMVERENCSRVNTCYKGKPGKNLVALAKPALTVSLSAQQMLGI